MSTMLDSLLTPAQRADIDAAEAQPARRRPVWLAMTPDERSTTLAAMYEFGGSFVASLAVAWRKADTTNSIRLGAVMGDYVAQYGPGSPVYAMVERRGA